MQKLVLTALTALIFSFPIHSQIGVKAGVTVGGTYGSAEEFDGDKIESIDPALGYQVGITGQLVDLGIFRLNGELIYENRRGVKNVNVDIQFNPVNRYTSSIEFKNSFHYLSVPLLASFGSGKLNLYVGPSFSYLIAAKAKTTSSSNVSPEVIEATIDLINGDAYEESYINRFNVAANAGVMFPIGPKFKVDVRIYHTLTDVTNDNEDRSIIDRILVDPQNVRLRDDNDSTVGLQANLVLTF